MITKHKIKSEGNSLFYTYEFYCLSTDVSSLPTEGITNGSVAIVMDAGKIKFFNEASGTWVDFSA